MTGEKTEDDHLAVGEFRQALDKALASKAFRIRVEKQARFACSIRGLAAATWKDLIQEVYIRFLDGRRHCPRNIPVEIVVLKNINWIAKDIRRQELRKRSDELSEELPFEEPGPDQIAHASRVMNVLQGAVASDPELSMMMQLTGEGHSAVEIQERMNMTENAYESTRRRLRRTLEKTLKKGEAKWTN